MMTNESYSLVYSHFESSIPWLPEWTNAASWFPLKMLNRKLNAEHKPIYNHTEQPTVNTNSQTYIYEPIC